MGNIGRTHGLPLGRGVVHGQVGVCRGMVLQKVEDATDEHSNGAKVGVTATAEAHHFATDAIFLGGEFEGRERGRGNVMWGGGAEIEAGNADEEGDVAQAKGGRVGRGAGVLTRAEKEKERDGSHIRDGQGGGVRGEDSGMDELLKYWDWDWFDPVWRGVGFGIGC